MNEPSAEPHADSDPETLATYEAGGGGLLVMGLLSAAAVPIQPGLSKRQRAVAALWTGSTIALGAAARWRPVAFARFTQDHTEMTATSLLAGGSVAIALGGGYRSPAYTASVATTTLGAAFVGKKGASYGGIGSAAYAAACIATARPWRPDPPSLWWNAGVVTAFWAAGRIGSVLGELALSLRSLEAARRRDRELLDRVGDGSSNRVRLELHARAVAKAAERLRNGINGLLAGAKREGLTNPEMTKAAAADLDGLHHLLTAPMLIAGSTTPQLAGGLAAQVAQLINTRDDPGATVTLDIGDASPTAVDPRTSGTLLEVLKRGLDNAVEAGRGRVAIHVSLGFTEGSVQMAIEDDAGGPAPAEAEWGFGLRASRRSVHELGGELSLANAPAGVIVRVDVPAVPADDPDEEASTASRVDRAAAAVLRTARFATLIQSSTQAVDGQTPRRAVKRLVRLWAVIGVGEVAARLKPAQARWAVPAAAIVASVSLPGRGQPASLPWASTLCAYHAYRVAEVDAVPVIATLGSIVVGDPRYAFTEDLKFTLVDRTFPLVCAAIGAAAGRARSRVDAREQELGLMADRLALIGAVARPLATQHDVLKQLSKTRGWNELRQLERAGRLPERGELLAAEQELLAVGSQLERMLVVPTPTLELLLAQLRLQLAPVPVEMNIESNSVLPEGRRHSAWALDRSRDRLWMVQLADEVAELVRREVPPSVTGRRQLRRVNVALAFEEHFVRITIRPIPMSLRGAPAGPGNINRIAGKLDGRLIEGYSDSVIALNVPPDILQ